MKLSIRLPDDMHVHLRSGDMLKRVVMDTAGYYGRAVVMPNLHPNPILDAEAMVSYRDQIMSAVGTDEFRPIMTIQVTESTTPGTIISSYIAGAKAGKVYPFGVTTNSENGVSEYRNLLPALEAMERCGMTALFHGEHPDPGIYSLDRSRRFIHDILPWVTKQFPGLKVVLEHVDTAAGVRFVKAAGPNVAATITVHHLFLTTDDILGGRQTEKGSKLQPHNFCKPVPKREQDRRALVQAALSGNPKFFLGTDSAPHDVSVKESAYGCAGVYVPGDVALSLLAGLFMPLKCGVQRLEHYTSEFGAQFYGLPLNEGSIDIEKEDWVVPEKYAGVVPFKAGETLQWRVQPRKSSLV